MLGPKKRHNIKIVTTGGFEPPPVKTSALNWRLRPLGQMVMPFSAKLFV